MSIRLIIVYNNYCMQPITVLDLRPFYDGIVYAIPFYLCHTIAPSASVEQLPKSLSYQSLLIAQALPLVTSPSPTPGYSPSPTPSYKCQPCPQLQALPLPLVTSPTPTPSYKFQPYPYSQLQAPALPLVTFPQGPTLTPLVLTFSLWQRVGTLVKHYCCHLLGRRVPS